MSSRRRKSRSRLSRIERRRATRSIVLSFFFLFGLFYVLFKFGIPLLIQMAILISRITGTQPAVKQLEQVILSAPVLNALPEATSSAKIRVTGYSPANTTVAILIDNQVINESLVSEDGAFDFSISLHEGSNIVAARATDDQGNESPRSSAWTVTRDTQPPELAITSPEDGSSFLGDSEKLIEITGTTDADSSITINGRLVIVSSEGNFSGRLELTEGENQLMVVARDRAGNETVEELTVHWSP